MPQQADADATLGAYELNRVDPPPAAQREALFEQRVLPVSEDVTLV